jgi:aminotransferase
MPSLPLSSSIQQLRFSVIREMVAMSVGMEGVINLGIGEPDFATPPEIIDQAFGDAHRGHTHYTPSQGDPELLAKLAEAISRQTGIGTGPDSVLITHGGMGALTAALRTILEIGDEVLLIEPHFPDYLAHITLAGGVARAARAFLADGFIPRPEEIAAAITPKTRVLILNSPNNPTGAVLPGAVLDAIAELAIRHNLVVVADEVYDQIVFGPPCESIYTRPGMADRTLVVRSFSKSHAMTGWRVGYCYGPRKLIEQLVKVVNYSTACVSSISQRAAVAALATDPAVVAAMRDRFAARVELVCARLAELPGVRLSRPGGSFYVFADISEISRRSREFAIELLCQERVVVVPGYAFGASGEGCIRLACTRPRKELAEACERIKSFIARNRSAFPD